jgi:hypothetical protein
MGDDGTGRAVILRRQICSSVVSKRIQEEISCADVVLVYFAGGQYNYACLFRPYKKPDFHARFFFEHADISAEYPLDL